MKIFHHVIKLLIFLLIIAGPAFASTVEDGHRAFNEQRYTDAFKIWSPLAKQGDAQAQYNLALLYRKGLGVTKDERKALEWLHKAAHQGMADAMYNIGVMFYEGQGTYRSEKSAIEWWTLAADTGHANAQYNLGVLYAYGTSTKTEPAKAIALWKQAADQGHTDAIDALIRAYQGGLPGIAADPAQAKRWQSIKKTQ